MAKRVRASRGARGGGQAGPGRFESKAPSDPQVRGRVGPLGPSSNPGSPPAVPAPRLPAPDAGHLPRSLDPALGPTPARPLGRKAPGRPPPASGKDTKYTERKMSAQQSRREKTNTTASILHRSRRSRRAASSVKPAQVTRAAPPRPAS